MSVQQSTGPKSRRLQVHIKLPKPAPGVKYSRKLLDAIAERWLLEEPLPPRVKVTAVSWEEEDLEYVSTAEYKSKK